MAVKTLYVIVGPTAVGKTELSLRMAEFFSCPIVNADSRQIYRDIPIGTAAPTEEELQRVKHYFVGMLNLDEYFSAARFEQEAMAVLEKEFQTHDNMVLSGGAMLYVDALCNGIDDIPTISDEVRLNMRQRLENDGLDVLRAELRNIDPQYYEECDLRNPKRIVHALEVYYQSGMPFSSFRTKTKRERPFRIVKIGLERPREELFSRINKRVEMMVENGLLDEVRRVFPYRHCNALNTVGYKEMFEVLDGNWDLDFAVARMQKNTRVYAKKQMTWYKKDESLRWYSPDTLTPEIIAEEYGRQYARRIGQ